MRNPKACQHITAALASICVTVAASGSPPGDSDTDKLPAEEQRLSTATFRTELKKRGLTELLELHVRDYPSASPTQSKLLLRDVRLTQAKDPALSESKRQDVLADANELLAQVVADRNNDPQRFHWRFTLAHSIIYDQAEPFFTKLLYRGGRESDRKQLKALAERGLAETRILLFELAAENRRIELLSIVEFDRLDAKGAIQELDELLPKSEYLLLWALFYDALHRSEKEPTRATNLDEILEYFAANDAILKTPHVTNRVQIQAMTLAGMTLRRLNRHADARSFLDRVVTIDRNLVDPQERKRVFWAITLAWVEAVRNDIDEGKYAAALNRVSRFKALVTTGPNGNFGLRIVAALLERDAYRDRSKQAELGDRLAESRMYRGESWQPLVKLAESDPQHRSQLFAAVYDLIEPNANADTLDPFEQCALVTGLLLASNDPERNSDALLDRAIAAGEAFVASAQPGSASLVPDALHQVATAYFRRGRPIKAAQRFLNIAINYSTYPDAAHSAAIAAQIIADLRSDPNRQEDTDLADLYRQALETLIENYSRSPEADYWRFHYAQLLTASGMYLEAAGQYERVKPDHEQYIESAFLRARCLAVELKNLSLDSGTNQANQSALANEFRTAARSFTDMATAAQTREMPADRKALLNSLLARTQLNKAETQILPGAEQSELALATLANFEETFPSETNLTDRVWRVRLLAYEALGRLDEAAIAIPKYIAAAPDTAAPTLQTLYVAISNDAKRRSEEGHQSAASSKYEVALLLAQQVYDWAIADPQATASNAYRRAVTIQLAEANLNAQRYDQSKELLVPLVSDPDQADDLRAVSTLAEARFQLGEYGDALMVFNKLAMGLPPKDPLRWKALLRDLQCRAALNEPPQDIIKVIQQQKFLYPELGGAEFASKFDSLLRKSILRRDANQP